MDLPARSVCEQSVPDIADMPGSSVGAGHHGADNLETRQWPSFGNAFTSPPATAARCAGWVGVIAEGRTQSRVLPSGDTQLQHAAECSQASKDHCDSAVVTVCRPLAIRRYCDG